MPAPVVLVGVNSWLTIAQADDYFLAKYGAAAWATLSVSEKTQLLLTAARWIQQQQTFDLPWTATAQVVRDAQAEAAWFVYRWWDDYEKRRALAAGGVKAFKVMDFSETLSDQQFPAFIAGMLVDYSLVPGSQFPNMHRDVSGNSSV